MAELRLYGCISNTHWLWYKIIYKSYILSCIISYMIQLHLNCTFPYTCNGWSKIEKLLQLSLSKINLKNKLFLLSLYGPYYVHHRRQKNQRQNQKLSNPCNPMIFASTKMFKAKVYLVLQICKGPTWSWALKTGKMGEENHCVERDEDAWWQIPCEQLTTRMSE